MNRPRLAFVVFALAAAALGGFATGQSSRPSIADKLQAVADDFGTTPAGVVKLQANLLGEPVLIANDATLHVGVVRDADRKVTAVRVTTSERMVEFNLAPTTTQPALNYAGGDFESFGATTDIDGDGRVDRIVLRHGDPPRNAVLLRLGERFEPSTGLGHGRFVLTADDKVRRFDLVAREWIVDADQTR